MVEGNYIGTDNPAPRHLTTTASRWAMALTASASAGASDNTVGGTTAAARNIISGNADDGIEIEGSGTSGNVVEGNFIGTDATGNTSFDTNGQLARATPTTA